MSEPDTYDYAPSGAPESRTYDMPEPEEIRYIPSSVRSYLLPNEPAKDVLAIRQHPAALWKPLIIMAASLALAITLNALLYVNGGARPDPVHLLWAAWVIVLAWYGIKAAGWYMTWIVVTPQRVVKISGLVRRQVVPLPMKRARDMELRRTLPGRILGYGTLYTQSFGTDHQLAIIDYVPDPVQVFNSIWRILLPGESVPMPGDPF
jgi:Bacterial PH domain